MVNTRFNPTTNGYLHVGHAYLALLNYHAATSSGGRFLVRFDDAQRYWIDRLGRSALVKFAVAAREDLEWLGIVADEYTSDMVEKPRIVKEIRAAYGRPFFGRRAWISCALEQGEPLGFPVPKIIGDERPYPYVPFLTAAKVLQDHHDGVNLLIRGTDLVSEFSLYWWFCRLLDVPPPAHQYVPKLRQARTLSPAGESDDLSDMSKTAGGAKIRDYLAAGWSPRDVISMLAQSCLIDPAGPWVFGNVKPRPILRMFP